MNARQFAAPGATTIGPRTFHWGARTYVMGVLNATPDSFSGDGLLTTTDPVATSVDRARRMVEDGADLLDVGGASSRPGHQPVEPGEETARVVPIVRAIAAGLPEIPISIDTTSAAVAAAALDAGAHLLNDVWGVAADPAMLRLAAERGVPIILMHNRGEPRYADVVAEVLADLQAAIDRAVDAGIASDAMLVDPGFGFGKTPDHNFALLANLAAFRGLGRPVLLGTSRKSTLGRLLDLPPDQRGEATVATTVMAVMARVDIVRVHDVRQNVRAARVADAVARGWRPAGWPDGGGA